MPQARRHKPISSLSPGPDVTAEPTRLAPQASAAGDAASSEAMTRLKAAVADLKQSGVRPLLDQAVLAIRRDDWLKAGEWALKALQIDEKSGLGWWLFAIAREKAGDIPSAIACYESALKLLPDHGAIANDLGRLAYQLGQHGVAEQLFSHFLLSHPGPDQAHEVAVRLGGRHPGEGGEVLERLRLGAFGQCTGHAQPRFQ